MVWNWCLRLTRLTAPALAKLIALVESREYSQRTTHLPSMPVLYRAASDLTVVLHTGYAMFIVLGQLAVLAGVVFRWRWIRNVTFRGLHLAAIVIVVVESLLEITCPLTTLEKWLRQRAGQVGYEGDFIANFVHEALFVDFEPWALTVAYVTFGLLVAVTFWLAPPVSRRR